MHQPTMLNALVLFCNDVETKTYQCVSISVEEGLSQTDQILKDGRKTGTRPAPVKVGVWFQHDKLCLSFTQRSKQADQASEHPENAVQHHEHCS